MTTIQIDITGYEDTLAKALDFHNKHWDVRDPAQKIVKIEDYLQQIITRNLEGLKLANTHIQDVNDAEAARARAYNQRRNLNQP